MDNPGAPLETPSPRLVRLNEYLAIVWRWRKFVFINVGAVALLSVIISLLLPNWYKSTVKILSPKNPDMLDAFGAASSVLKGVNPSKALGFLSQDLGPYNYLAILKSRTAMQDVIDKFDLMTIYDIDDSTKEDAIKELEDNTNFEVDEDEYIAIDVLDKDPQRAADMANYFADILNKISIDLGTREARSNREFIEGRVAETWATLRAAEDSLRRYQETTKMIIPLGTDQSSVSPIADLYGMKAKKEIELGILRKSTSPDNPMSKQLEVELNEIIRQINTFPEIGMKSLRLYRDVIIQQKTLEYLLPLYEQSRIDEQKDVPVILVLDKAVPAEKKDKPKRMIIVVLSVIAAGIMSILAVLGYESALRSGLIEQMKVLYAHSRS